MPQMPQVLRERAVGMLTARMSTRAVARELNVHFSTISRLQRCFREFGSTSNWPHNSRPRVTTPATRTAAATVGLHNQRISAQTVRNHLREAHLHAHRPHRGLHLTAVRRRCLAFARGHQDWQIHHWRPVIFTDESRFTLSTCDRRDRVWRRRGERSAACNILQHDRSGSGSVMVWGGISLEGRTALHVLTRGSLTAIRYRDEILRPLVRPYAGAVGRRSLRRPSATSSGACPGATHNTEPHFDLF
uniref:Transposase Tc1-like domain-containing protein n=1 Tax=Pygocentrus nattereri TaxID=42514 RepID=A0AAR2IPX8_PYGNA